ncbi:MAG: S41 family peptidase [Ktedonobacteraceae bacterium]
MSDTPFSLTAEQRSTILERLFTLLQDHYVFPEVTRQVQETLHQRLHAGDYDKVTATDVFCELITEHLYEVSHDRHLSLWYRADTQPFSEGVNLYTDPKWQKTFRQEAILQNFGFQRVERLTGNIGYLDLRSFFPPEFAGDTAVAVMAFLAYTHALIIDLRSNDGGENYMAHLLSSYLFEGEPLLLNSFYLRPLQSTQQCWTLPYVPGKRYAEKPVYVLTGPKTASAAEEFVYTLQQLKRVTVVGERTMGAANPIEHYQITQYVAAYIPIGRAINAVTGTNWEGTGVIPDREVPAATALKVAHLEAVQNVLETLREKASPQAYSTFEKEARLALRELLSVEREQE